MEAKNFIDVWLSIYLFDLLRYLIPASLAFVIFWVIARKGLKHLFIQTTFPNSSQLWREFAFSMSTVIVFSIVGFGLYSAEHAGFTRIYYKISDYGWVYMFVSFVVTLIFHDFYFYWTHRLMHHKRIFKYVHRVHHQSTSPSPWAAYSFHPWEAFVQALVLPIMVFTIPIHPLIIFLFLTYMIVRNVIGHLGFEILPKGFTRNKWLNWNTAITHHDMHHQHFHGNYGLYFTWWDKWMKTEHSKYHETFDEVKSRPKRCELKTTKKGAITVSLLLVFSTFLNAQTVEGKWITYNEKTGSPLSVIEIVRSGNSIEGRVAQVYLEPFQGEDPICTKCTGERKNQHVLNMNFLWGFRKNGNDRSDGKILDPENGEVYDARIWLEDNNTMKVRGYGGMFDLFYRTQTWKRKGESAEKSLTGLWYTIDDTSNKVKSEVEIVEKNGELFGYIKKIYLLPHEGTDPVCVQCEGKLKDAKIVGMKILSGFRWNGKTWEDGKILDPGNGNVYSSTLWIVRNDELLVRGYIGPFYRTQVWKRQKS
jgi:Delta7-sterol 5-desaturase